LFGFLCGEIEGYNQKTEKVVKTEIEYDLHVFYIFDLVYIFQMTCSGRRGRDCIVVRF